MLQLHVALIVIFYISKIDHVHRLWWS